MKRTGTLILSIFLLLSLAACGNSGISQDDTSSYEPPEDGDIALEEGGETVLEEDGDIALEEDGMIEVNITINSQVFAAKFYDNESAQTIISEMPFTLEMSDYASQEKVTDLPFALPSASTQTPAAIKTGDIYLWSGNNLVLFYTSFSNSYSYVPVGYIVDTTGLVDLLGNGNAAVSFQLDE